MGLNSRMHHDFMLPLVPIVQEVGMRGIYLDQAKRQEMVEGIDQRLVVLDEGLRRDGITKPESSQKLSRELAALGVPLEKKTEGGQYQVDLEVLGWANFKQNTRREVKGLPPKFPFLAQLIERSKLSKAGKNLRSLRICDDGLLRTRLNALGTKTLRYSSGGWGRKKKPGYCPSCDRWAEDGHGTNLQNIPKDNEELGVNVKEVLGARPGWLFGELDGKALELHIQAYRIGSDKLIERIESPGSNMHALHAKLQWEAFNKDTPEGKRQRGMMKNVIYGLRGGGGDRALQIACAKKNEFIELADLARFRKTIFGEYPEMPKWIEDTQELIDREFHAGRLRVCRTGFGWPRVLFGSEKDALKEWLATEISGTAAGGLNYVLYRLAVEVPWAYKYVSVQIHDSLCVHAPKEVFHRVMQAVYEMMVQPWWVWGRMLPVGVEAKWGERWSGMEEWVPR